MNFAYPYTDDNPMLLADIARSGTINTKSMGR